MNELEAKVQKIHDDILSNRREIRNCIEASEARILLKFEEMRKRLLLLERENCELREEVEGLKRKQNKKNILIFGLNKKEDEITPQSVCDDLSVLIGVQLKESDIGDVYPLGRAVGCPIKVELNSYPKKREVLNNCHKLRGKKIAIAHDLTAVQRRENNILRKHLLRIKQEGNHTKCVIRGNKLLVDGTLYGIEELEVEETPKDKPNSAPSTPLPAYRLSRADPVLSDQQEDSGTPNISPVNIKIDRAEKPAQLDIIRKPRTRSDHKN